MKAPPAYQPILDATLASGFDMASDPLTCSLLATLAASKPGGRFLELGTGTGLSTAWILQGMDPHAHLISLDNSADCLAIATKFLGNDPRLDLIHTNGDEWIAGHQEQKFDFIFADTWPGKYHLLDEVLNMLQKGGLYIIDDMLPQPNWPDGHHAKATTLSQHLLQRSDVRTTRLDWATGIVIAVKI
jgi:predicted O-methyltransferase YrrM